MPKNPYNVSMTGIGKIANTSVEVSQQIVSAYRNSLSHHAKSAGKRSVSIGGADYELSFKRGQGISRVSR